MTADATHKLLAATKAACEREHASMIDVLRHLARVDRTRAYTEAGASSMFSYCVERLGLSEGAAMRRILTARCIMDHPEVLPLLRSRKLSLCSISEFATSLSPANKIELLREVVGKSKREVRAIIAQRFPQQMPIEKVRPIAVRVFTATTSQASSAAPFSTSPVVTATTLASPVFPNPKSSDTLSIPTTQTPAAAIENRFELKFSVSDGVMAEISEAKDLLWHKYGQKPTLEQTMREALRCFLELRSPKRRAARREAKAHRHQSKPADAPAVESDSADRSTATTLSTAVRDAVLARGRCEFTDASGHRCTATAGLEVDHRLPRALGGGNDLANLRCLCSAHNKQMAVYAFGADRMSKYIRVA